MPLFRWNEEFSVNCDELDSHHKTLIGILNSLYDECMKVDATNCVGPKIDELISYSDYHFKAEEHYMRQIDYFEVDEHIEKHEAFSFKIRELRLLPHESDLALTQQLIVFLGKWLLKHVLDEDKKYAVHALSRN